MGYLYMTLIYTCFLLLALDIALPISIEWLWFYSNLVSGKAVDYSTLLLTPQIKSSTLWCLGYAQSCCSSLLLKSLPKFKKKHDEESLHWNQTWWDMFPHHG
jgi:hypothetical protein